MSRVIHIPPIVLQWATLGSAMIEHSTQSIAMRIARCVAILRTLGCEAADQSLARFHQCLEGDFAGIGRS